MLRCSIPLLSTLLLLPIANVLADEASQPKANDDASQSAAQYVVAGHVVRVLGEEGQACQFHYKPVGSQAAFSVQNLNLLAPCYLLLWQIEPARKRPGNAAVPVGKIGAPLAWRYASAKNALTLAVIGDPVGDNLRQSALYRLRQAQNMHCAGSVQGILIRANQVNVSQVRGQVGVLCLETGMDEKDFWLLAHAAPKR